VRVLCHKLKRKAEYTDIYALCKETVVKIACEVEAQV